MQRCSDPITTQGKTEEEIYAALIAACKKFTEIDIRIEGWCLKLSRECVRDKTASGRIGIGS